MLTACTIVARNYLPHARVLTASFLRHHPDGAFFVLLIDDEDGTLDTRDEPFAVLRLRDLGLERREIERLGAIYDVVELATSVKPVLLQWLLDGPRDHAIYLDPDIKIFGSLADVAALAEAHGVVLTPHTTVPVPRDGRRISTEDLLGAGVFNLGFVAVGPAARPFLAWWWSHTRRHALVDPGRMLFTDQRWIDLVPAYFDPFVVKDPGLNVAYWNLHGRAFTWTGTGYEVDGRPLRFFHFSGFDHRRPHLLSKHQADRPRILLSDRPALRRVCGEYLDDLHRAGINAPSTTSYGWESLPSGLRLDRRIRRLYWAALVDFEEGRGPEPPHPFDPDQSAPFVAWLNRPDPDGPATLSRYELAVYRSRGDLQPAFPRLDDPDEVARLRHWLATDGIAQEGLSPELLRAGPSVAGHRPVFAPASALKEGVNVAGYLQAELGIGEAARLLVSALEAAGIDHATIDYGRTLSRQQHAFAPRGDGRGPFDVNVVCVNADATPRFARDVGPTFFDGRHTAGYWFWELERFPATLHGAFAEVDEVWTATRFVASAVAAAGVRPVYRLPLPVRVGPIDQHFDRRYFGLPDGFVFLFAFDFLSVVERKNPFGLIEAFTRAFRPDEGPTLVIKTINGHLRLTELEHVRAAIGERTDIRVVDAYYSRAEQHALTNSSDCYVSLHRSEGLGLTMAEAMSLGKPVIATAYSGNLDFMTPANSFLVDYATSQVPAGVPAYAAGTPWADPHLDLAAACMRQVVADPAEAAARAARGRQHVTTTLSAAACGAAVAARLDAIRAARRSRVFTPASPPHAEAAPPAVRPALEQASALLTPVTGVPPTARWRGLRLGLQTLLLRILRPYWFQQRQVVRLTLDAVRAVDLARAADAARLDATSRDVEVVKAELARLSSRVDRIDPAATPGRPRPAVRDHASGRS